MTATTAGAKDLQVLLDADDGIDYDMERNITTARKNVRLTRGDLLITADKIGHVRYQNGLTEYRTDFLTYNMLTNTGKSADFRAVITGEPRDFHVKGAAADLNQNGASLSKVAITRCPKAKPDYVLSAARVSFSGRRVQLKHVVFKMMGIPVLYLPVLVFYTDYGLPYLEPGYDKEDYGGYKIKYQFLLVNTEKREWNLKGELSSKGDANIGLDLESKWENADNQTELLYYYWHDSWKISNKYTYKGKLFTTTLDGFKEFNDDEESQLGINFTRNFWRSPFGEWQAGLSIRRMLAEDRDGAVYGGTYSGVRLDYKPLSNVQLSLLEIKSYSGNDYRDLMDDFGLGTNFLYAVDSPMSSRYTFGVSGSYNLTDSQWYHEVYSITADFCCYRPTISYDRTDHSWDWVLKIKF
jgi:hypothetical protein